RSGAFALTSMLFTQKICANGVENARSQEADLAMLIEFRVRNHRSVRDEQVLTMEAGRVGDTDDLRPRVVAGYSKSLLPAAALYGANASGKSNVLSAIAFMREAVVY